MNPVKIVVCDDEEGIREFFKIMLSREGYQVTVHRNGKETLGFLKQSGEVDIVIADIQMPEMSGLELLSQVKELHPDSIFILMTAYSSAETAIQAIKLGAYDYIKKPFKLEEVKLVIQKALESRSLKNENIHLKKELGVRYGFDNMVGFSPSMRHIFETIQRIADSKSSVLITGESGTGKELIARATHYNGKLKDKPFVIVNCGAIPENLVESEMFGHKKGAFTGAVADKKAYLKWQMREPFF